MPPDGEVSKVSRRAATGGGKETDVSTYTTPYQVRYQPGQLTTGVVQNSGADWFGPLNPMSPVAPPEVSGRLLDYPSGYNLNIRPRAYEPVTFETMRALADGYDLMRLVIETRKDQMASLDWNIKPRDPKAKIVGAIADRIKAVEEFFIRPDKVNFWDTWLRMVLEDVFVIDAPALHLRRTRGGTLYSLEQIDGATIKRVIDDWARTPEPPTPAYQQVLKGYPAVDYTTKDLLYRPRNQRVHKVYGYSPVEQVIMTVNIALRRQVFQLNYFTEGTVPEALIGVPDTWTPDQIRQFQDWFDSILTGNLAERRRARFVPSAMAKTYVETKQGELFGAAEEWFAKVICFAFSISAQPFLKMMNRASAETAQEVALEEGLAPIQKWVKGLVDTIIIDEFGFTDIEFTWNDAEELDPTAQSKILETYTGKGIMPLNEARGVLGLDPYDDPAFNKPMVITATGYVFVSPTDQATVNGQPNSPVPSQQQNGIGPGAKEKPQAGPGGVQDRSQDVRESAEEASAAQEKKTGKLAKAAGPSFDRPRVQRSVSALTKSLKKSLKSAGADISSQIEKRLKKLGKADSEIDIAKLIASLDFSVFEAMEKDFEDDLGDVAADAGKLALAQVGGDDAHEMFDQVNDRSTAWASKHAAQLVGTSKNPKYSLPDSTRDMIRGTIAEGLAAGKGSAEIADQLQTSYAFSEERAALIANTEIRRANSAGSVEGYKQAKEAGVNVQKEWLLGNEPCDECETNADEGPIDLDDVFPSGDDQPPAHPNCNCSISPVVSSGEEEEDEDE